MVFNQYAGRQGALLVVRATMRVFLKRVAVGLPTVLRKIPPRPLAYCIDVHRGYRGAFLVLSPSTFQILFFKDARLLFFFVCA